MNVNVFVIAKSLLFYSKKKEGKNLAELFSHFPDKLSVPRRNSKWFRTAENGL